MMEKNERDFFVISALKCWLLETLQNWAKSTQSSHIRATFYFIVEV